MAVDITGFNRMRREQEEKARKEAEGKCQEATAQSNTQTNISQDASTPKAGGQAEQKAIPAWEDMSYSELKAAAKEAGIKGYGKMSKAELIEALKEGE